MPNPDLKKTLEDLLAEGLTRIVVVVSDEVDIPDRVRQRYTAGGHLPINLSWKFDGAMDIDDEGVSATLSFDGEPYPCRFPFDSIIVAGHPVADEKPSGLRLVK